MHEIFFEEYSGCYRGWALASIDVLDSVVVVNFHLPAYELVEIRDFVGAFALIGDVNRGCLFLRPFIPVARIHWKVGFRHYLDVGRL